MRRKWFDKDKLVDWARSALVFHYRTQDELIFDCPACGRSAKLWLNTESARFTCYYCKFGGSAYALVEFVDGVSREQSRIILGVTSGEIVQPSDEFAEVFQNIAAMSAVKAEAPPNAEVPGAKWFGFQQPEYQAELEMVQGMYAALQKRGFEWNQIVENRAGWAWGGRFDGRVLLPAFVGGSLVFWQAWDWTKTKQLKYDSPKNENVPISRQAVVYNLEKYATAQELVVCEGCFNSWSVDQTGYPGVCTFGKAVSAVQILKLVRHPAKRIFIGLDPDAWTEAVRLHTLLTAFGKEAPICKFPEGKDFNDLPVPHRKYIIETATKPDWFFDARNAKPPQFKS